MLNYLQNALGRHSSQPQIHYVDCGVDKVVYTLPKSRREDLPSVLAFAMPKSGSVLLDRMLREVCAELKLSYVSIMEEFFRLGIPDNLFPADTANIFVGQGYCYGGFRYLPKSFEIPIIGEAKKILLVRDPRDMLVSHYFSMLKSHPERGKALQSSEQKMKSRELAQELAIDDYALRMAKRFLIFLQHYQHLCETEQVKVYRYEDVIYRKADWLSDICAFFDWPVAASACATIAARHDVIPSAEDEANHIRQVHPGNYKKKLQPATIEQLDAEFAATMQFFGYEERGN